jgi:hypothetical protein
MVRNAIAENVPGTAGKLGSKTIGIFIIRVLVVISFTGKYEVITGPLTDGIVRSVIPA